MVVELRFELSEGMLRVTVRTRLYGYAYRKVTDKLSLREHKQAAALQGGTVMTVHGAADNDWVADVMEGSEWVWLGNDIQADGSTVDPDTDEAITYTNWSSSRPSEGRTLMWTKDTRGKKPELHKKWSVDWDDNLKAAAVYVFRRSPGGLPTIAHTNEFLLERVTPFLARNSGRCVDVSVNASGSVLLNPPEASRTYSSASVSTSSASPQNDNAPPAI